LLLTYRTRCQFRHAVLDPAISIGMVADWDCIVRKLVWVADGRVKPGNDGG
jgi:hypothetical protein